MVFDLQPRLASGLLLLRPLSAADFDPLYAVAADPAVWEQHPSKDRTEEPAFTRWFDDAFACGGALVAVDRATGEVFGHFEVQVDDVAAAVESVVALGGQQAEPQPPDRDPRTLRVMLDPAGHPFCLWS